MLCVHHKHCTIDRQSAHIHRKNLHQRFKSRLSSLSFFVILKTNSHKTINPSFFFFFGFLLHHLFDVRKLDGNHLSIKQDHIPAGTVVLTEDELPDCELPTSDDPTCMVAETDEGVPALVACRDIKPGEWFSIGEDSSEDDDAEGDGEESGGGGGEWGSDSD